MTFDPDFTDNTPLTEADLDKLSQLANGSLKSTLLNHVRQLESSAQTYSADGTDLWGEAYVDANGRNNSVDTNNISAEFDVNKYKCSSVSVLIEATSLTTSDFSINNCLCAKLDTGKYILSSSVGTDAQKRANIYKTLFYGSDGSDPRATSTYITGLTALKTSVSADVGKKAFGFKGEWEPSSGSRISSGVFKQYAAFSDTTSNAVEMWYRVFSNNTGGSYTRSAVVMPVGTIVAQAEDSTSDNFGGAGFLATNPDGAGIYGIGREDTDNSEQSAACFGLYSAGSITLTLNKINPAVYDASYGTDYQEFDFNIPFTAMSSTESVSVITHTIPTGTISSTISSLYFKTKYADFETGASTELKLTNSTEDSGWLTEDTVNTFTAFTSEPTSAILKLVPKTTSPTAGYPPVNGFSIKDLG